MTSPRHHGKVGDMSQYDVYAEYTDAYITTILARSAERAMRQAEAIFGTGLYLLPVV